MHALNTLSNYRLMISLIFSAAVVVFLTQHTAAQTALVTVAYTSFEEPSLGSRYTDSGNAAVDHPLSNNSGESAVNYAGGQELGFTAAYANTRSSTGLTDGDDVGVTALAASYPDGTQGYQFSDTDGRLTLTLDTVSLSSVSSPHLSLQYFLQETSWETDDTARIWVITNDSTEIDLLNTASQDIDNLNLEGSWRPLTQDLTGYTSATLHISLDSNSGLESLFIDNIVFSGSVTSQPGLTAAQTVTAEPLLGGQITYDLTLANSGQTPVIDKGYNLTITDTLPVGLSYLAADPVPTFVEPQPDGTTLILWDNIADLDAQEELTLQLTAVLSDDLTIADQFANQLTAAFNTVPDNSGDWLTASSTLAASPQAIDIEAAAKQSTADEQATGAGEYDASPEWPYSYTLTIKNNNVGSTDNVVAVAVLPPGVAYMGNPQIAPNSNGSAVAPALTLLADGSLELSWSLGALTTAQHTTPVEITFDTAIPYRFRTAADTAAAAGPFAGPMSGAIIYEDVQLPLSYEATGDYDLAPTADGTESTPDDDTPVVVTGEYFTVSKSATPKTVGINTTVDYTIDYYVSEYYDISNPIVVDILPDGTTYVDGSASLTPVSVEANTPSKGQTTITWHLANTATEAGASGSITFEATVDPTYEAAPYTNQPIVSGDSLTNQVTIYGDWADFIAADRSGTTTPDTSKATVNTRMPTFTKEVQHPTTSQWGQDAPAFVGDTLTFRLTYNAAVDIDAKEIVIRDFLPRGMTFVNGTDTYTTSGTFTSSGSCASAPSSPTIGTLNGLQYLEWRLCNTAQNSSWQVTLDALVGPTPDVQPGWIVANFGKLSGQNTYADTYSLRELATVDYLAPNLVVNKSAAPRTNLQADDTVNYTITVTNNGDATAYNIILTDILPADVIFTNSGGSAAPTNSSYTTTAGNPSAGSGGTVQWNTVAALAPGATQTYQYTATIPSGLIAGQSMTNLASVAYNSRPDNNGHQVAASSNTAADNTAAETIYIRGLSVQKSADPTTATIGDTVTWTIVGTVPDGVGGFWPVVEENNLPNGFDYITGTTQLTSSTGTVSFDPAHGANPLDNGRSDLRWFLSSITNNTGDDITFTLTFDTLVTGVNGNNINQTFYSCCDQNADNDAFIGWYDTAAGYNNSGSAYDAGFGINNIDRRSPEADADVRIYQPRLTLNKSSDFTYMHAGGALVFTLQVKNTGKSTAYDINLTDALPAELTYDQTLSLVVAPNNGENATDNNSNGSQNLTYLLDQLPVGATWTIQYAADIDPNLAAGLEVNNVAQITSYSSQPSVPADSNADTLADERVYSGPTDTVTLYAPKATLFKERGIVDELTFGNTVVYTLTVPQTPLPAIMHNVQVSDLVDERLEVTAVDNGSFDGNSITAAFTTIGIDQQETIVITAVLPQNSSGLDGEIISNQATFTYDNDTPPASNMVSAELVAPALVTRLDTETFTIAADEFVTYTAVIENVGHGRAENLTVSYDLPAELSFVTGSATLNGQPLTNPTGNSWNLSAHPLEGGAAHTLIFQAQADSVSEGVAYDATIAAAGTDSLGAAIPADNSGRVPADSDLEDIDDITIYGPLTCTTENTSISFEDLKNTGWSDWDYNDLIVRIDTDLCVTVGNDLAIATIDYLALARGAGFTHSFWHDLPVNGRGRYQIAVYDNAGSLIRTDSGSFADAPDFEIFQNTKQIFEEPAGGCNATGDVFDCLSYVNTYSYEPTYRYGYSATLTVLLDEADLNPTTSLSPTPWDPYITVFDTGEEVHRVIPGHLDNSQTVGDTYDPGNPMVGYDLPLVQTFDVTWDWPIEFSGIWRGYPEYVDHIATGGATNADWFDLANAQTDYLWTYSPYVSKFNPLRHLFSGLSTPSRYFAAPVTADLNNDGQIEILIGNLLLNQLEVYNQSGRLEWTVPVNGGVKAAVTVADLTQAVAGLEILVPSEDGYLYAFHADGSPVSGWPVRVGGSGEIYFRVLSTPAVADLNGDNALEVVVAGSNGRLYTFAADGTPLWDSSLGDVLDSFDSQIINSSPVIADLDGNGELEIIVGSYDKAVYAFTSDGSLLWRFETGDVVLSTPAVDDIDPDVDGLEVVFGSGDSFVYLLDEAGDLLWQRATNWSVRSSPLVAALDDIQGLEIVVGSDDDTVWVWDHDGAFVARWSTEADVFAQPTVGDIDGNGVDELIVASDDGKLYAWGLQIAPFEDWSYTAGASIKGRPAVLNLDSDPEDEIVYATMDGELRIIGGATTIYLPLTISN